ncbi:MAG: MoxR family ATPase, partial [Planctomycetota bacterium]|nr:MoxR family ATPase [Planctomycetota bacterium]
PEAEVRCRFTRTQWRVALQEILRKRHSRIERQIVRVTTAERSEAVRPVLNAEQILRLQRVVWQIPLPDTALAYAVRLARLTRPTTKEAPAVVKECVSWGAGPRAAQHLVLAAKARAALHGRFAVDISDIQAVALPVLRHRIVTNFNADAEGVTSDAIVTQLLKDLK